MATRIKKQTGSIKVSELKTKHGFTKKARNTDFYDAEILMDEAYSFFNCTFTNVKFMPVPDSCATVFLSGDDTRTDNGLSVFCKNVEFYGDVICREKVNTMFTNVSFIGGLCKYVDLWYAKGSTIAFLGTDMRNLDLRNSEIDRLLIKNVKARLWFYHMNLDHARIEDSELNVMGWGHNAFANSTINQTKLGSPSWDYTIMHNSVISDSTFLLGVKFVDAVFTHTTMRNVSFGTVTLRRGDALSFDSFCKFEGVSVDLVETHPETNSAPLKGTPFAFLSMSKSLMQTLSRDNLSHKLQEQLAGFGAAYVR